MRINGFFIFPLVILFSRYMKFQVEPVTIASVGSENISDSVLVLKVYCYVMGFGIRILTFSGTNVQ